MNYLIIGLGNFGLAVATRLTAMGHDVLGIDSDMHIIEENKDKITTVMQLNITDQVSLRALPLDDTDEIIVSLGENLGDSILIVSLLKQAGVKHIIARAINPIHQTILETLGVDEVILPEKIAADQLSISSDSKNIKGVYSISDNYHIIEYEIPTLLEGLSITEADLETTYSVNIVSIKRQFTQNNFLGGTNRYYEVIIPDSNFKFQHADRIIIYGLCENINRLKKIK